MTWYIWPINSQGISRRWHTWRSAYDDIHLLLLELADASGLPRGRLVTGSGRIRIMTNGWYEPVDVS